MTCNTRSTSAGFVFTLLQSFFAGEVTPVAVNTPRPHRTMSQMKHSQFFRLCTNGTILLTLPVLLQKLCRVSGPVIHRSLPLPPLRHFLRPESTLFTTSQSVPGWGWWLGRRWCLHNWPWPLFGIAQVSKLRMQRTIRSAPRKFQSFDACRCGSRHSLRRGGVGGGRDAC